MTMVTQAGSLRERKKSATRRRIVDTAIRLFSERGFEGPTIDEIAGAAEIGKGTVYNYFSTKEEILVEFMVGLQERVQRRLARFAEAPGPLERILREYILYHFRLNRPYLGFTRVLLAQLILRGPQLQEHVLRMQTYIDPPLREMFGRWQQRGLVARGAEVERLVEEFKGLHFGLSCLWAMEGPPFRGVMQAVRAQVAMFARAKGGKKP